MSSIRTKLSVTEVYYTVALRLQILANLGRYDVIIFCGVTVA